MFTNDANAYLDLFQQPLIASCLAAFEAHYMAATKVFSDFAILLGGLPPPQTPLH